LEISKDLSQQFGIAEVDGDLRINRFHEKPKGPVQGVPGDPGHVLASMGIYLFRAETLIDALKGNKDDFGTDIIPAMIKTHNVFAYPYPKFNRIEDDIAETSEEGERELRLLERTRDSAYWLSSKRR
jgi:glucose-1-phosphate adenylyltransferase